MNVKLKPVIVLVLLALIGIVTYAVLTTETSCRYYPIPSNSNFYLNGQQTYWEKLVGGLCHPLTGG